ncbi:MAG: carboxypeptidase-like regulatory domain-containing protein [Chloroflexota bacterium]
MTAQIVRLLLIAAATLAVTGCGGSASGSAPSASAGAGGAVRTESDAVARVIASEPRFAGITPRDPDLIGQGSWYEATPASGVGAFLVTMRIGWGDCPAGCIDEHSWTYAVGPDGSVKLQSEAGSPVPADAWPSPAGDGTSSDTGIRVTAVAGPVCPVEKVPPDPACAPKPVSNATILIGDAAGHEQAMVVTDAGGQAFAGLAPGVYTVTAQGAAGFMNGPEPQQITVDDGNVTEVTLTYDTGIR